MALILNDENLKQLDTMLGEIPAKYSLGIILYINQIQQAQQKAEADKAKADAEKAEASLKASKLKAVPVELKDSEN